MKRISSLGMGLDQRPLLVVSVVMSVAEGAAWHYGGKSSPLQPCWALTYLPFWYFIWLFTATEEWAARCWGEMRALKAAFSFLVNTESCWCATVGQRTTNTFFSEPTVGALIKDIHYLHRILLTVTKLSAWPCTFSEYLTTLFQCFSQMQMRLTVSVVDVWG